MMNKLIPVAAFAMVFAAGCGKKEEQRSAPPPPQRPPVNQEESKKIPVPPPPLPGPSVPKIDARPLPGAEGGNPL